MSSFSHVHHDQADPEKVVVPSRKHPTRQNYKNHIDEGPRGRTATARSFLGPCSFVIMIDSSFTRVAHNRVVVPVSRKFRGVHVGANDFGNVKAAIQPNQPRTRTSCSHGTCGRVGRVGVRRVELARIVRGGASGTRTIATGTYYSPKRTSTI
jgi:hypothetical protein